MIEICAIFLTIGAILYHFNTSIFVIGIVTTILSGIVFYFIPSKKGFVFAITLGLVLILGSTTLWIDDNDKKLSLFGDKKITAKVLAVDRRLDREYLIVEEKESSERVRVSLSSIGTFLPGDIVVVDGYFEEPSDFVTKNGRIFEYQDYLQNKGINYISNNPNVDLIEMGNNSIQRIATIFRYKIAGVFSKNVTFPFDGVLAGMLIGYQGGLPSYISDIFRNTGVLHVLVLSGYNITIMVGFLTILMRNLPFKVRNVLMIGTIILLVLISGGGIASIRAGIMGSIALFAGLTRRTYDAIRALTLSFLFFFFISPNTIFSDPGFHLSFLATFFMIGIIPKIEKWFHFIPNNKTFNFREFILLAISMPIFTLPYIMYFSGNFPLFSPIANMLMALATPVIMILGAVLLISFFIPPVAMFVGTILSFLGSIILFSLGKLSLLPIWNTPPIPWWSVVILYSFVIIFLFKKEISLYLMQIRNSFRPTTKTFGR